MVFSPLALGEAREKTALFRLLFALAIEPLSEAIKTNTNICGLTVTNSQHNTILKLLSQLL